jgi:hypothetical protein
MHKKKRGSLKSGRSGNKVTSRKNSLPELLTREDSCSFQLPPMLGSSDEEGASREAQCHALALPPLFAHGTRTTSLPLAWGRRHAG